jgi:hypothetical protein
MGRNVRWLVDGGVTLNPTTRQFFSVFSVCSVVQGFLRVLRGESLFFCMLCGGTLAMG